MGRGVIVALQGAANGANRMNAGNRFSRGADRLLAVVNIDRSGRVNELPLGLARWELERRRRGIVVTRKSGYAVLMRASARRAFSRT